MKKVLFVFLALIALGLVVVGVILIPPHLQIRRIEPALPTLEEVEALLAAESGPIRISAIQIGTKAMPSGLGGNAVFVIEWEDGRLFMVDAGMDKEAAVAFAKQTEIMGAKGEFTYRARVDEVLGEKVKSVQGVGFTHLHIDHVQGLSSFCKQRGSGAKVYQSTTQASIHNLHTEEGARIVRESCLEQIRVEADKIVKVPGFPGLAMFNAGGHTPGTTIFFVSVGKKLWVLSGDVSNNKQRLLNNQGKGFLYSYLLVPENTRQLEKLRKWLTELDANEVIEVIVSHDGDALAASDMHKM